ncbi:MAG: hypothetical protein WCI36_05045 [bacterium]
MHAIFSTPSFAFLSINEKRDISEIITAVEFESTTATPKITEENGEKILTIYVHFDISDQALDCLREYYTQVLGWKKITQEKKGCHKLSLYAYEQSKVEEE